MDASVRQQVLHVNTHELTPLEWAWPMARSNYGNALSVIGNAYPFSGALEQALEAYERRCSNTQDRTPLGWAMTSNNLAVTLRAIGERDSDLKPVDESADTPHRAVHVRFEDGDASELGLHQYEAVSRSGP